MTTTEADSREQDAPPHVRAGNRLLEWVETAVYIGIPYAVRITVVRRELIAEPFLLVGIIASIKEIVVLSVKAAEAAGGGTKSSPIHFGRSPFSAAWCSSSG